MSSHSRHTWFWWQIGALGFALITNGCAASIEVARACYERNAMPIDVSLAYEEVTTNAQLDGHDVILVIDTGATHNFIPDAALHQLSLAGHLAKSDVIDDGILNSGKFFPKITGQLDIGKTSFGNVDFLYSNSVSIPSHDPNAAKQTRLVLGAGFLSAYSMDLDLQNRQIVLIKPQICDPDYVPFFGSLEEAKLFANRIYTNASLNRHKILSVIDTGADNTTVPSGIAANLGLTLHDATFADLPIVTTGATGNITSKASVVDAFTFGPFTKNNLPVVVASGAWAGRNFVNVGLDVLRSVRLWKPAGVDAVIMTAASNHVP